MNSTFKKLESQILVGDFVGSCFDSSDGHYSIGWYCSKSQGRMDSKNYVLIRDNIPAVWGEVTSRIYEAKVSDTGRFALHVIGKTNQSTLRFFELTGQEFASKRFTKGLFFFDISADGQLLFLSNGSDLTCLVLSTMKESFGFELESKFVPSAAKMDSDGKAVLLQYKNKAWYRFDQSGVF